MMKCLAIASLNLSSSRHLKEIEVLKPASGPMAVYTFDRYLRWRVVTVTTELNIENLIVALTVQACRTACRSPEDRLLKISKPAVGQKL